MHILIFTSEINDLSIKLFVMELLAVVVRVSVIAFLIDKRTKVRIIKHTFDFISSYRNPFGMLLLLVKCCKNSFVDETVYSERVSGESSLARYLATW